MNSSIVFLKNYLPNKAISILDVGCGRGAGIYWLLENMQFATFTGIDYSSLAIDVASQKFSMNSKAGFFHADIYDFDFSGERFDYILMVEVLEHLERPFEIIEKYKKHCREAMYLTIPSINRMEVAEHLYAYGDAENPFERYGAELLPDPPPLKKFKIEVKK